MGDRWRGWKAGLSLRIVRWEFHTVVSKRHARCGLLGGTTAHGRRVAGGRTSFGRGFSGTHSSSRNYGGELRSLWLERRSKDVHTGYGQHSSRRAGLVYLILVMVRSSSTAAPSLARTPLQDNQNKNNQDTHSGQYDSVSGGHLATGQQDMASLGVSLHLRCRSGIDLLSQQGNRTSAFSSTSMAQVCV